MNALPPIARRLTTVTVPGLICAVLLSSQNVLATTYIIRPDGTGDFPTIQAAVNASLDGDIIELTDGTFLGEGNRDIDYIGKAITVCSQSGNPETCIIHCGGYPHQGFRFQSGEPPAARIEGVTITNAITRDSGGAIYCSDSSPTIGNCIIRSNGAGRGAGIYCGGKGASPTISGCTIDRNLASETSFFGFGGGIYCDQASPMIVNCTITDNRAIGRLHGSGGGIHTSLSSLAITGCTISGNFAESDGGGITCNRSSLTITQCLITGNDTSDYGYGGGVSAFNSNVMLRSCTLAANFALGGGAVYIDNLSSISLDRTIVWGNCASGKGSEAFVLGEVVFACCAVDPDRIEGSGKITFSLENVFVDPLFCEPESCRQTGGDYGLRADSPCSPEHSPGNCELIGALPVGCEAMALEPTSWGAIKARHHQASGADVN